MSYVTQNLLKGETVEYSATIHWIAYFTAVFWSLVGIILLLAHFVVGVLPLLYAAFKVLSILARELAVTNKRVIGKTGLIRRDSIELRHEKVETIRVDQTILGRILGYGTGGTTRHFVALNSRCPDTDAGDGINPPADTRLSEYLAACWIRKGNG